MISSVKNSALTDLQVRTLNIREKELNYWSSTFKSMASMSALLAGKFQAERYMRFFTGFCYGGLSLEIEGKIKQLTQLGYLSVTTAGMGCGLLCIVIASLVS